MTTVATAATKARDAVQDVITGRALRAFYVAVLLVALVGSALAAEDWLNWWFIAALGAVALYELGGVALSIYADHRRQKGERAIAARLLSAAFAAGAVAIQLFGHTNAQGEVTGPGFFFAGFSAAAYCIYLLDSGARRRDALRDAGKLADTPPAYGVYQWVRHPWLTRRARALAVANAELRLVERITSREADGPDVATTTLLGRAASLAAAAAQIRQERRNTAVRGVLRNRIAAGVDPQVADIAIHTFDLDRVAEGLAEGADYDALTELLAAELTPQRIAAGITARSQRRWFRRSKPDVQTNEIVAALTPAPAAQTAQTGPETRQTGPETEQTGRETAQSEQTEPAPAPASALPVVPADARLLPVRCAVSLTAETAPVSVTPTQRTTETDQTDWETETAADTTDEQLPPVPEVNPGLLHHLLRVMQAHGDWALTIHMPHRHPEALTGPKIKVATGISGQQTVADIRAALKLLSGHPGAQQYVEENAPAWARAAA